VVKHERGTVSQSAEKLGFVSAHRFFVSGNRFSVSAHRLFVSGGIAFSYQGIALAMPQVLRNQSPLQGLGVGILLFSANCSAAP
jgi:hypothetical protein